MNKNYQKQLEKLIEGLGDRRPRLLLHACCAPCSSYCIEYLSRYFDVTLFFYNPNITVKNEYEKRAGELRHLTEVMPLSSKVQIAEGKYEPQKFFEISKGLENIAEGGERCFKCYELRLRETAEAAKEQRFDYFSTTLSISPLKNAGKLNEIGGRLSEEYGVNYLFSDFKKNNGYKRSIELSKEYNLYRQNYCGCVYSKKQREAESKTG